jgi:hypothetical protein
MKNSIKLYFIVLLIIFGNIFPLNSNAQTYSVINNNQDYLLFNQFFSPFGVGFPWGIEFSSTLPPGFYDVDLIQSRNLTYDSQGVLVGSTVNFKFLTYFLDYSVYSGPAFPPIYTIFTYGNYNDGNLIKPPPYNEFIVGTGNYVYLTAGGFRRIPFTLKVQAAQ